MKQYIITDFGAKTTDRLVTKEIQQAIDTCFLNGGGTIVVPEGVFRIGCLRLRSNCTLYLEAGAYLEGSRDPEDYTDYIHDTVEPIVEYPNEGISRSVYPYSRWNNAIIRIIDAENVSIIGEKGSCIDGCNPFDELGEEQYRGPHGMNIQNSKNIHLEGYTLRNTGNWAHAIFITKDIVIRNVKVYGGHDGIDVRTCDNVLIEDCNLICGDDAIAGFDNNDVLIRRCHMDTACSALRFGGNNVIVEDCDTVAPASFGHRWAMDERKKRLGLITDATDRHTMLNIFLYYCDHRADPRRTPGNIILRNCRFVNPERLFSLEYDGQHVWCCNRSLSSIKFENCTVDGIALPSIIWGDENEKLTFELENVTLKAREGCENEALIEARNYDRISFNNVAIEGYAEPRIDTFNDGIIKADVKVCKK